MTLAHVTLAQCETALEGAWTLVQAPFIAFLLTLACLVLVVLHFTERR